MKEKDKSKLYIPLFLDFNEKTKNLKEEECGRLVRAMVCYANEQDYEKWLVGAEMYVFPFIQGLIDSNKALLEARSRAGSTIKSDQNGSNEIKNDQKQSDEIEEQQKEAKRQEASKKKELEEMFDRFWKAYPRHEAKANALKAFEKLKPTEELLMTMLNAIKKQASSAQWLENGGQYIPHPATWLNQRRWEDEPVKGYTGKTVSAQQYQQRDYSDEDEEADRRWLYEQVGEAKKRGELT